MCLHEVGTIESSMLSRMHITRVAWPFLRCSAGQLHQCYKERTPRTKQLQVHYRRSQHPPNLLNSRPNGILCFSKRCYVKQPQKGGPPRPHAVHAVYATAHLHPAALKY
jgi:hypothetical protein